MWLLLSQQTSVGPVPCARCRPWRFSHPSIMDSSHSSKQHYVDISTQCMMRRLRTVPYKWDKGTWIDCLHLLWIYSLFHPSILGSSRSSKQHYVDISTQCMMRRLRTVPYNETRGPGLTASICCGYIASPIPVSWVLPAAPSSTAWTSVLIENICSARK